MATPTIPTNATTTIDSGIVETVFDSFTNFYYYNWSIGNVGGDINSGPVDGWFITPIGSNGTKLAITVPSDAAGTYFYQVLLSDLNDEPLGSFFYGITGYVNVADLASSSSGSSSTTSLSSGSSIANSSSGQSSSSRRSNSIGSLSPGGPSQSGGISAFGSGNGSSLAGSSGGSSGGSDTIGSLSPTGPSQSGGISAFSSGDGGSGGHDPGGSQDSGNSSTSGSFSLGFDKAMPLAWQPVGTPILPIY